MLCSLWEHLPLCNKLVACCGTGEQARHRCHRRRGSPKSNAPLRHVVGPTLLAAMALRNAHDPQTLPALLAAVALRNARDPQTLPVELFGRILELCAAPDDSEAPA